MNGVKIVSASRRRASAIFVLLLMLCPVSGCIFPEETIRENDAQAQDPPLSEPNNLSTQCIEFEGVDRCWTLLVPATVSTEQPVPLVLDLHGYGHTSASQMNISSFASLAVEEQLIVAYPQGYDSFWGLGFDGIENDLDDVGFLSAVIESVTEAYPVDEARIHMSGWSKGCKMTQRFAVETQGVLASIGCMSGYLMTEAPSTYIAPVPFMEVHGVLDTTVSYADNTAMTVYYFQNTVGFNKGAMQNLEYWADLNGCSGAAPEVITVNADYDIRGYSDCTSNAEVRLMSLFSSGHNPYLSGNPTNTQSTAILWDFMSQFALETIEDES